MPLTPVVLAAVNNLLDHVKLMPHHPPIIVRFVVDYKVIVV